MQIDPLLFLIMTELLLVTAAVSVVLAVIWFSRKRRDKKAAMVLVARIKEDRARRKQETKDILVKRFGVAEGQAEELTTTIDREEKRFYQILINTYLRRDVTVFENMYVEYESAVDPYRSLEVSQASEKPAGSGIGDINESAEMLRLKEENKRLSEEVRITMETMGRMLSEYSAMFAGGGGDDLDKEKIKSMFQEQAEGLEAKLEQERESREMANEEAAPESEPEAPTEAQPGSPELSEETEQQDEESEEPAEEPVMFGEAEAAETETGTNSGVGEITVEEIPVVTEEAAGDSESSPEQTAGEGEKKE
jgi:hypothetical protein